MAYRAGEFPVIFEGDSVGRVTVAQNGLMTVFDCACSNISADILRLAAVCDRKYISLGIMVPGGSVLRLKKSYSTNALTSLRYQDTSLFYLIRSGEVYKDTGEMPQVETPAAGANDFVAEPPLLVRCSEPLFPEPEPEAKLIFTDLQDEPETPLSAVSPHTDGQPDADAHAVPAAQPDIAPTWEPVSNPCALFTDPGIQDLCAGVSGTLKLELDGITLFAVPISSDAPFSMMPVFCFGSSGDIDGQDYIIFKIKNGYLSL